MANSVVWWHVNYSFRNISISFITKLHVLELFQALKWLWKPVTFCQLQPRSILCFEPVLRVAAARWSLASCWWGALWLLCARKSCWLPLCWCLLTSHKQGVQQLWRLQERTRGAGPGTSEANTGVGSTAGFEHESWGERRSKSRRLGAKVHFE